MSVPNDQVHTAPTLFLLMAQYNGRTVVPLDQVCRDFFGHLTVEKLIRKALRGDVALPILRIETSQKAQRGVHLVPGANVCESSSERRQGHRLCLRANATHWNDIGTTVVRLSAH